MQDSTANYSVKWTIARVSRKIFIRKEMKSTKFVQKLLRWKSIVSTLKKDVYESGKIFKHRNIKWSNKANVKYETVENIIKLMFEKSDDSNWIIRGTFLFLFKCPFRRQFHDFFDHGISETLFLLISSLLLCLVYCFYLMTFIV